MNLVHIRLFGASLVLMIAAYYLIFLSLSTFTFFCGSMNFLSFILFTARAVKSRSLVLKIFECYYIFLYQLKFFFLVNYDFEGTLAGILLTNNMLASYANANIQGKVLLSLSLVNLVYFFLPSVRAFKFKSRKTSPKFSRFIQSNVSCIRKTDHLFVRNLCFLTALVVFSLLSLGAIQLAYRPTAFGIRRSLPYNAEGIVFLLWSWSLPIMLVYLYSVSQKVPNLRWIKVLIVSSTLAWVIIDTITRNSKASTFLFLILLILYAYEIKGNYIKLRLKHIIIAIALVIFLPIIFVVMGSVREISATSEVGVLHSFMTAGEILFQFDDGIGIFDLLSQAIAMAYLRFTGVEMMFQLIDADIELLIIDYSLLVDLLLNRLDLFEIFYGESGSLTVIILGLFANFYIILGYFGLLFLPAFIFGLACTWETFKKNDKTELFVSISLMVLAYQFISTGSFFTFFSPLTFGFIILHFLLYRFALALRVH